MTSVMSWPIQRRSFPQRGHGRSAVGTLIGFGTRGRWGGAGFRRVGCWRWTGINNEFCALFTRNRDEGSPTFLGLNFLRQSQLNIGRKEVAGIDFEATCQLPLADLGAREWGDVLFRVFGTRVFKLDDQPNADDPDFVNPELREIRRPLWVVNSNIRWTWKDLTLNYSLTFLGKQAMDDVEIETAEETFVNPYADRYYIHDAAASYQVTKGLMVYGGVNNLTGLDPIGTSTSYPVDPRGRMFFLGITSRL